MPEPMAMPCDTSSGQPGMRTPISDSELVRTCLPSCLLMSVNEPFCLSWKRSSVVPSEEAAKTTPRQVNRPDCEGIHAADLTELTFDTALRGNPGGGLNRTDFVAGPAIADATHRFDVHHLGLREDPGSVLLGQVEVAKVERILRAMAATHHATAALDASRSEERRVWKE